MDEDVVVVGAGAAGLAAAALLRQRGIDPLVLEQDGAIGGSWARRYDRLHLHTVRAHSGLPGLPIPRDRGTYLSRDAYAAYLEDYTRHHALRVRTGTPVAGLRVVGTPSRWQVVAPDAHWRARAVVVATGQYRVPVVPALPGRDLFAGDIVHSVDYRSATAYAGKRVLVVGAGNSGAEIATDLAERGAAFVALAIRTPPPVVPRDPFGQPVQKTGMLLSRLPPRIADRVACVTARLVLGDLSRHGYPQPAWWPYSSRRVPVIDVGFVAALKRGAVQVRPALARMTATEAIYADGRAEAFDAIVMATGFTSGLEALIDGNGVLDAAHDPIARSGEPTALPGLYFNGYVHSLRGHLYEAARAARVLADNVVEYLARTG